jgi:glutathione synthase/RimK-type ligase-like ATP-grasp enzyme
MPAARYVLLLAEANDLHALAVGHFLQELSDCVPVIVDTAELTSSLNLKVRVEGATGLILGPGCSRWPRGMAPRDALDLDEVRSVWVRRYRRPKRPAALADEADQDIARRDSLRALDGLLHLASRRGVRLLNPFPRDSIADNKLLQLDIAHSHQLTIPRTLVSNDPEDVRRFYRENRAAGRGVIVKSFRSPDKAIVFTRLMEEADLGLLDCLRHAPAIFQEYVEGDNLRVTVVGREVFPAQVLPSDPRAAVDWRMDYFSSVQPFPLDPDSTTKLLSVLDDLGLVYGAFDLKRTAAGDIVFLEVNPGGQFLFVEIQTGMAISAAVARYLIG